jgi:hypothetical protein
MELHFGTYREIITEDQNEIKSLIIKGNEVNNNLVEGRLYTSALTAYFKDNNKVIATSTIKIPEVSYINAIFNKALSKLDPLDYIFELGYVFVDLDYRNKKLASTLCSELVWKFKTENLFSTTRTDNLGMQYILNILGFIPNGNPYPSIIQDKLLSVYIKIS